MRFSQREVAKFLEICYLQLKDHPVQAGKLPLQTVEAEKKNQNNALLQIVDDYLLIPKKRLSRVRKEVSCWILSSFSFSYVYSAYTQQHRTNERTVRATANEARVQHGMTSGLMKQFMVTAEFVADDLMPMMKKVIKKRKSKIIMDILETVLLKVTELKTEAERVKDRYNELRGKLQANISDVNKRNKEVVDTQHQLSVDKEEADNMVKQCEKQQREMEEERRRKHQEIEQMRAKRDEFLAKTVPSDADDKIWGDLMKMSAPTILSKLDIIPGVFQIAKIPFYLVNQGIKTYGAIRTGQEVQTAIDQEEKRQSNLREQIRERQETTQDRLAQIKRIDLKAANLGDIKSLMEALVQLSKVDEMFGEIILFWDNMEVFLKSLQFKTGAGKSFLKAIKRKKYAEMFEETITAAEKEWKKFGSICRAYASQTDQEIRVVYGFLSKPVDLMDVPARETKIRALTYEIECDAAELEY